MVIAVFACLFSVSLRCSSFFFVLSYCSSHSRSWQADIFTVCSYHAGIYDVIEHKGLCEDAYWTIHITPESDCSYASFETNVRLPDYTVLVKAVLAIFKPERFTMTLLADVCFSFFAVFPIRFSSQDAGILDC